MTARCQPGLSWLQSAAARWRSEVTGVNSPTPELLLLPTPLSLLFLWIYASLYHLYSTVDYRLLLLSVPPPRVFSICLVFGSLLSSFFPLLLLLLLLSTQLKSQRNRVEHEDNVHNKAWQTKIWSLLEKKVSLDCLESFTKFTLHRKTSCSVGSVFFSDISYFKSSWRHPLHDPLLLLKAMQAPKCVIILGSDSFLLLTNGACLISSHERWTWCRSPVPFLLCVTEPDKGREWKSILDPGTVSNKSFCSL